ncbi:toll-like receptor 2 type-2 [Saccostrea echinata]|uniref:toll-like receptor 2 type-2 n=1 Tax=Saccostrea echinata TaxID=191078 RepID=UPI002A81BDE6|nr:toll-like receptor 2 type-2 [Saccostrea echinata]
MPNLEILILKENKLTEVPKFCLPHKQRPSFPLLKVLDLSDNFLYDVTRKNFHGQCLPNLKSLKLGHNKIKFVPENLIADLSTLHPYIILAISISFGGTFITCLSCLFYQKRWHIKYYLYLLRAKRRGYEILAGDEFAYDVFLAYNSNDRIWVISELIPKLEKEENLKLCLHDRDFQVGKLIVDNITDTMHRSRKVLIILSNSFAQSHWCRFETMLAQLRLINNGKETVIVVILENILTKNMTNSLHVLLKTITFIEWTNEKSGKEMFWNRLVAAVKS